MKKEDRIVVTVEGGVVQDVQFRAGCDTAVAVHDYDVDGADDLVLERDERGDAYVEALWEPAEAESSTHPQEHDALPAEVNQGNVPAVAAQLNSMTDAQARSILVNIYRWLYWDDENGRWSLDKEISGADTVELLCELLPGPHEAAGPGGGP